MASYIACIRRKASSLVRSISVQSLSRTISQKRLPVLFSLSMIS